MHATADRPQFPEGYGVPTTADGLLPWRHARERLESAQIYWVASVRPDLRPHVSPIWGVWLDDLLFFDGSPASRRGQNIAQNPAIAVSIESGGAGKNVVFLEGRAYQVRGTDLDPALTVRLAQAYAAKYAADNYAPAADSWNNGGLYRVQPQIVIAWTALNTDPTRWTFDPHAVA